jgi:hypothetical protein
MTPKFDAFYKIIIENYNSRCNTLQESHSREYGPLYHGW